jgi:hypothetical protein
MDALITVAFEGYYGVIANAHPSHFRDPSCVP